MSAYKCICCGVAKESEMPCSCPVCGYRMFKGDYDRKEKLKEEILSFVSKLRPGEKDGYRLEYFREDEKADKNGRKPLISKDEDDKRFPELDTIQRYVRYVDRTETFAKRSIDTVNAIRGHLTTGYGQSYHVAYDELYTMIKAYDEVRQKPLPILDIQLELPEIKLPDATVTYEEIPNDLLVPTVLELTDALLLLCEKIRKFIKLNNLYGDAYKKGYDVEIKSSKDKNYIADLGNVLNTVKTVVAKEYVVDILEGGSREAEEMLSAYWVAIKTLLSVPVLKKKYAYSLENGISCFDNGIFETINGMLDKLYYPLYVSLYIEAPLAGKSEQELFDIYNKMIEIDTMGIMGVNKDRLLRMGEHEKKLNELIGLGVVKESVRKLKAFVLNNKGNEDVSFHMCFYGNPGTGKTEVARIIAGILYENKILPTDKVIEVSRKDLVGEYIGETPRKTESAIDRAMGGVLFIDEAYSLIPKEHSTFDYGHEAVATLIKAMEDYRSKFCVILAGYRNEMLTMLESNPGFKSRIQFELDFPNYAREELGQITDLMLSARGYTMSEPARSRVLDITDVKRKEPNFANAREIRNILDQAIMCQSLRTFDSNDREIGIVDVEKYIKDAKISLPLAADGRLKKVLTADEELDELVGLDSVKRMVRKIRAYAKRNKDLANFNVHMCFYGNPGTGKTEVARIISRILYDAGVLEEAKMVETDAHGLIGRFVGETAHKTEAKIRDSMGGVLFIDEAYSLTDASANGNSGISYGDEAIAVLLKRMEDSRGRFCVILAGYQKEMKTLLSSNQGLESRIQFTIEFPDYTREELSQILVRFATKKGYIVEDSAAERLLDVIEYYRGLPDFANARTVRNILDQVVMNQNLRTEDTADSDIIILSDVEDYISDEKITFGTSKKRTIGFC